MILKIKKIIRIIYNILLLIFLIISLVLSYIIYILTKKQRDKDVIQNDINRINDIINKFNSR